MPDNENDNGEEVEQEHTYHVTPEAMVDVDRLAHMLALAMLCPVATSAQWHDKADGKVLEQVAGQGGGSLGEGNLLSFGQVNSHYFFPLHAHTRFFIPPPG
jgi:hypothetical protein